MLGFAFFFVPLVIAGFMATLPAKAYQGDAAPGPEDIAYCKAVNYAIDRLPKPRPSNWPEYLKGPNIGQPDWKPVDPLQYLTELEKMYDRFVHQKTKAFEPDSRVTKDSERLIRERVATGELKTDVATVTVQAWDKMKGPVDVTMTLLRETRDLGERRQIAHLFLLDNSVTPGHEAVLDLSAANLFLYKGKAHFIFAPGDYTNILIAPRQPPSDETLYEVDSEAVSGPDFGPCKLHAAYK